MVRYDGPPPSASTSASASTVAASATPSTSQAAGTHSKSSVPTAAIAGGIVGGLLAVVLVVLLLWYLWRRRKVARWRNMSQSESIDLDSPHIPPPKPFMTDPSYTAPGPDSEDLLRTLPDFTQGSDTATSITLLGSANKWPSSPEGKRALHPD